MKKITALLLALALALGLTACGGSESKQLVGTWQCAVDITTQLDKEISGAMDTGYTSETPMQLQLSAAFQKDGSFTLQMDADASAASFRAYIQALKPTIVELAYQEAEKQGMTRAEYDTALADTGLTADSLADSILSAFDVDALLGGIEGDMPSGRYKLADGRLYLSDGSGSFKLEESVACTLSGSTMTWTDDNALLAGLDEAGISAPLVWTKQP